MPNRLIREGILTSERVNALSWEEEVFYRRLMSVVDDFGRFTAHPSLLRAALYPLKLETIRDANMERLLASVEQARLVRVYEVEDKRYLEVLDFRQQVRAKVSKYPDPPGACASDAQHTRSIRGSPAHLDGGAVVGAVGDGGAGASPRGDDANMRAGEESAHDGTEDRPPDARRHALDACEQLLGFDPGPNAENALDRIVAEMPEALNLGGQRVDAWKLVELSALDLLRNGSRPAKAANLSRIIGAVLQRCVRDGQLPGQFGTQAKRKSVTLKRGAWT